MGRLFGPHNVISGREIAGTLMVLLLSAIAIVWMVLGTHKRS
jgi:hypothetical protein